MAKPTTDSTGQIQRRQEQPADRAAGLIQRVIPELARALPKGLEPERMARIALTAIRSNPKLAVAAANSPGSFLGSLMQAAQLGLEINTPLQHAWLVPRKNEVQLMVGYQGKIELALRSAKVSGIFSYVVRDGDDFLVTLGLDPSIRHVPSDDADREDRKITYVYAVAKMRDAEAIFVALSRAQVEKRRARSDGYNYQVRQGKTDNPWFTDEEEMFKKTAIHSLCKYLPKSAELIRAMRIDETQERGGSFMGSLDPEITQALQTSGVAVDTEGEVVESDGNSFSLEAPPDDLEQKLRESVEGAR